MRESQIKVAIRLIKMQLQGGSITQSEYDEKLAELTNISSDTHSNIKTEISTEPMRCVSDTIIETQTQRTHNPQPKTHNSQLATIDAEKSRLSNLLHTIPSHKSAKHLTDQIIALRKKRKEAYTEERYQRTSTDGMNPVSGVPNQGKETNTTQPGEKPLYRQMENLRINIGRWEKSLEKLMGSSKDAMHCVSQSEDTKAQISSLIKKINDGKIKYKSLGA
ncbi:MAG: hypothetical protein Q8K92_19970 [Leadbetterella sp.]|nr:hypothetical protein [Leadbetterella sp.]